MAYQAIYRKWRPTTFEDVVGQSHITETLKNEIKSNRLAHAYLFCGTRGTGKTTTAKILSRAVNCENITSDGNPCNECPSCKGILTNTIMDVVEIDAASNNGVDNIRDLRDEISYTPANVKYKIYIIDEVHMLSPGAFNALLKTLEEPPAHAIFILATTEPHKIPATIQSRCQRFDFCRISVKNIAGRIGEIARKDGIDITPDAVKLVAELGDGSMRDALSILDLCAGMEGEIKVEDIERVTGAVNRTHIVKLAKALAEGNIADSIKLIGNMLDSGRETQTLIDELLMCFRELLVCKVVDNPQSVVDKSEEDIKEFKIIADTLSKEALIHIIKTLSETAYLCKTSTNPRVMLESSAVKICDPSTDPSTEAFASRIAKLEAMMITGVAPTVPVQKEVSQVVAEDEEEEYVCDAEEFYEEDLPPFDVFSEVTDENMAEKNPVPYADEKPEEVLEETVAENEAPIENARKSVDMTTLTDAMMLTNPALGAILKQAELMVNEDTYYVVFDEVIFKKTIEDNKDFVEGIKKALDCSQLKIVTKNELEGNNVKKDPLEDIADLANSIEQITLI